MAGNSIEINSNVNDINIQPDFNKITVVNPDGCFVTITQPITNVIQVATPGPAGSAGPAGPSGSAGTFETGSFATTGSNNFIGNQIITGSLEVTEVITGSIVSASYAISSSLAEEASNNFDIIAYNNTTFNITAIRTNGGQQTATITNVPSSSYTSTASYVNPLQQNVIITGSLNTTGSVNFEGGPVTILESNPGEPPSILRVLGDIESTGYHRFDPVETNIDTSLSASYIYVSGSTQDLYFTQNGGGYNNTTRLRWLEGNIYTGLLWGGVVTGSAGSTTFTVTEGAGLIVTMNNFTGSEGPNPTINYVTWDEFSNITPTYLNTDTTTWLLIDPNGNLVQQNTGFINGDYDTKIVIGQILHPNLSTISLFKTNPITSYAIGQQTYEFIRVFGALKISGHTIAPSGSSLYVNRSSGVSYALGRNYVNDPDKPSYVSDEGREKPILYKYYKLGSEFVTSLGVDTIDPSYYNTPSTPTGLSTVPGGQYSIKRFFYYPNEPNILGVYYGRTLYNSLATALANLPYETFEENNNTANQAIFCGYLIVKGSTSDLSNTSDAKFIQAGLFRTTTAGGAAATTVDLNSLSDVTITSPTNNQILSYELSTAQWKNNSTISITNITASGNISSSGIVYGTTGSFSHLQGNSPITVGDSVTFQQPITASTLTSNGSELFLGFSGNNITIQNGADFFISSPNGSFEIMGESALIESEDGFSINVADIIEFSTNVGTALNLSSDQQQLGYSFSNNITIEDGGDLFINAPDGAIVFGTTTGTVLSLTGTSALFQVPITSSALTSNDGQLFLGYNGSNNIIIEDGADLFINVPDGVIEIYGQSAEVYIDDDITLNGSVNATSDITASGNISASAF